MVNTNMAIMTKKPPADIASPEEIEAMRSRIAKLEEASKEYNTGTKLLIRRDLELSRANDKLKKLDEIKSNFISVVAHQLRTPLSGVKWTLNMIINEELGPLNNDQKTFLMKTYESNSRMITLVNDMLVADGIQSGRTHYRFKYINLPNLMDNVIFEINPQALKKDISITYKSKSKNLPQVFVDPEKMRAVLQNLLENAIKYTIQGGEIDIDMKTEEKQLIISITDNGIGIPQDQQKEIFAKFFRAKNAITRVADGSGLGLYIAKTIIEKNGGKIWFESVEDRGTTFYFSIPLPTNQ
jgi:signal transduction histidine kinase